MFKIKGSVLQKMLEEFSAIDLAWIFVTFVDAAKSMKIHAITHEFSKNETKKYNELIQAIKRIERKLRIDRPLFKEINLIQEGEPIMSVERIFFEFIEQDKYQLERELSPEAWEYFWKHCDKSN